MIKLEENNDDNQTELLSHLFLIAINITNLGRRVFSFSFFLSWSDDNNKFGKRARHWGQRN